MVVQNIDKGKYPPATYSVYAPQIVSALDLNGLVMNIKGLALIVAAQIGSGSRITRAKLRLIVGSAEIGKP